MRVLGASLLTAVLLAGCGGGSGPEDVASDFESAVKAKDGEKAFAALCDNDTIERAPFVEAVNTAEGDQTEVRVEVGEKKDDDTYLGSLVSPAENTEDKIELRRVDDAWCIAPTG